MRIHADTHHPHRSYCGLVLSKSLFSGIPTPPKLYQNQYFNANTTTKPKLENEYWYWCMPSHNEQLESHFLCVASLGFSSFYLPSSSERKKCDTPKVQYEVPVATHFTEVAAAYISK